MKIETILLDKNNDAIYDAIKIGGYFDYLFRDETSETVRFNSVLKWINSSLVFLLKKDDVPIGLGVSQLVNTDDESWINKILDLYVESEHRGEKLSDNLINTIVDVSAREGIKVIRADYNNLNNFMTPFLDRFGFKIYVNQGMNYAKLDLSKRFSIAHVDFDDHSLFTPELKKQLSDLDIIDSYKKAGVLLAQNSGNNLGIFYNLDMQGYGGLLMFQDDSQAKELLVKAKENFFKNKPLMDYSKIK